MGLILLIVLIALLLGALPRWSHSANWGYYPASGLGTVVLIIVVLMLLGRI
jgi:hypothetical protein